MVVIFWAAQSVSFALGYMRAKKFGVRLMSAQMTVVARKMGRDPMELMYSIRDDVRKEMHCG